ncbi:WD repeat-containing protein 74 [Lutzomyia longipalpis]|uniref:WD repeat-containing protein 74 n=1 Tax=Lutzomyia longipalpis TaxID=7200 RepID=UPI0024846E44|nr:WD repeat-containing protein 74 [Lutzomyia longipalpis]
MFLRNVKESSYTEDHRIYVGSCVGALKEYDLTAENPYKPTNFQKICDLELGQGISALKWGNEEETEILVGRKDSVIQIYDLLRNSLTATEKLPKGEVVSVCRADGKLIGASNLGQIYILGSKDNVTTFTAGTDISRMRQCKENTKLLATGGKERKNNLKVWNIEQEIPIFSSKNVPHDNLQLEVPVWDSDVDFLDSSTLVTASRYGYIRTYDIRTQRRPVKQFVPKEEQLSFSCLATYENLVYVGLTTGGIRAFDTRSLKFPIHTYKGPSGSITDLALDHTGKFLCSSSLDRNVRINSTINNTILYQCYVKTKPSRILIKSPEKSEKSIKNEEIAEESIEMQTTEEDFTNDKLLKRLKRKRKLSN